MFEEEIAEKLWEKIFDDVLAYISKNFGEENAQPIRDKLLDAFVVEDAKVSDKLEVMDYSGIPREESPRVVGDMLEGKFYFKSPISDLKAENIYEVTSSSSEGEQAQDIELDPFFLKNLYKIIDEIASQQKVSNIKTSYKFAADITDAERARLQEIADKSGVSLEDAIEALKQIRERKTKNPEVKLDEEVYTKAIKSLQKDERTKLNEELLKKYKETQDPEEKEQIKAQLFALINKTDDSGKLALEARLSEDPAEQEALLEKLTSKMMGVYQVLKQKYSGIDPAAIESWLREIVVRLSVGQVGVRGYELAKWEPGAGSKFHNLVYKGVLDEIINYMNSLTNKKDALPAWEGINRSLNKTLKGDPDSRTFGDLLQDVKSLNPEEQYAFEELKEKLLQISEPEEKIILEQLFEGNSLQDIAIADLETSRGKKINIKNESDRIEVENKINELRQSLQELQAPIAGLMGGV